MLQSRKSCRDLRYNTRHRTSRDRHCVHMSDRPEPLCAGNSQTESRSPSRCGDSVPHAPSSMVQLHTTNHNTVLTQRCVTGGTYIPLPQHTTNDYHLVSNVELILLEAVPKNRVMHRFHVCETMTNFLGRGCPGPFHFRTPIGEDPG